MYGVSLHASVSRSWCTIRMTANSSAGFMPMVRIFVRGPSAAPRPPIFWSWLRSAVVQPQQVEQVVRQRHVGDPAPGAAREVGRGVAEPDDELPSTMPPWHMRQLAFTTSAPFSGAVNTFMKYGMSAFLPWTVGDARRGSRRRRSHPR